MGSQSDYSIMKDCEKILKILKVRFQVLIVSAHRTPRRMYEYALNAEKNNKCKMGLLKRSICEKSEFNNKKNTKK